MKAQQDDLRDLLGRNPATLSTAEITLLIEAEGRGNLVPGEMPIHIEMRRNKALDQPSYMATEILDHWYKEHFEHKHYELMDEVLGPYLIGETVTIEGMTYDPRQYTGMLILFSRSTLKSTILRMMIQWIAVYRKLRLNEDSRTMLCHQVMEKAVEHSDSIRATARQNERWRETFPEFAANPEREWDQKAKWRWPCFSSYQATEFSLTCYGETSSKIGGHYTERMIDDWVTDQSVTTPLQQQQSIDRFAAMDNLRDRSRQYNPWLAMGTNYHFQDAYQHVQEIGGWIVWRVPAHTGSPKKIFEIASMPDRTQDDRKKIDKKVRALEKNPPGTLNFPTLLDWKELVRSARMEGPNEYNCQLLLNPVPEGEQRFDRQILEESWVPHVPTPEAMWVYLRCDPALSRKREADETAIIVGGVGWNGVRYIIDGWVGREHRASEIVLKTFTLAKKWINKGYTVKDIGFEAVQFQEALAESARRGVPERGVSYSGESIPMVMKPCPIRSIKRSPDIRKRERIMEMDGPITRRELKFWSECSIGTRAMQQFCNFPFDRDDILDAVHDLWVGTSTPPRSAAAAVPPLHPELMKLIRFRDDDDGPQLVGTNSEVSLANWN